MLSDVRIETQQKYLLGNVMNDSADPGLELFAN